MEKEQIGHIHVELRAVEVPLEDWLPIGLPFLRNGDEVLARGGVRLSDRLDDR